MHASTVIMKGVESDCEMHDERLLSVPRVPGPVLDDYRTLLLSGRAMIDVRAPVEYDKGHLPSAVNLPLMNDHERHEVGTRYRQAGQESAIRLGAELVTPTLQQERIRDWQAFMHRYPNACLYCFRGGLRSRIAQQWLIETGASIPVVQGGYKALRRFLLEEMERLCACLPFVLIGGRTGNGKTMLIKQLGSTLDLEGLANHRGSSFGHMPTPQPRPASFENAMTCELMRLEDCGAAPVYLEDEAKLIGRLCIPDPLRAAMLKAPVFILECDIEQRIRYCFDDYVTDLLERYCSALGAEAGFEQYSAHHRRSLARIQKRFGPARYQQAVALLDHALQQHKSHNDTTAYSPFIELLLRGYYDPMYDYQLSHKADRIVFRGTAEEILERAAATVGLQ